MRILIWPDPSVLSAIYSAPTRSAVDGTIILAGGAVICLVVFGIYLYCQYRKALFWYLLFFLGLLPISQIIPLVPRMNDRYLYFPLLGAAGVAAFFGTTAQRFLEKQLKKAAVCTAVSTVVALAVAYHIRGRVWKATITLFSDMIAKVPTSISHGIDWPRGIEPPGIWKRRSSTTNWPPNTVFCGK